MQWIAPSEKDTGTETLEKRLWAAADELRANSGLTSAQYSQPVLGLIFLRFAEVRFLTQRAVLEKQAAGGRRGSRVDDPTAYQAEGILYLTPPARFDHILRLPEGSDVGKAVNKAMRDIEAKNPQLPGVLPKTYQLFNSTLLKNLLKKVSEIPATAEGDTFGRVYEYFLGEFARTEGSRGGEFYTPISKNKQGLITRDVLTKHWTDWVDYWAVDFNYESRREIIKVPKGAGVNTVQGHLPGQEPSQRELELPATDFEERWTGAYIFENEWQSFRTRQKRALDMTTAPHTYEAPGRYTIAVKVIDIFGNDTITLVPITVG